jgi:UDP-2-acetamido-3-amino-2,3-dideoxy-glucuronate N-acetyltransferase
MIHPLSDVQSQYVGENTQIWQFAIVLSGAIIGKNCNVNCHTFIENDVVLGDNVTVKSGVYLWDGIRIHDNVFIGPNVTFTNDLRPKSKKYPSSFQKIIIQENASIGAGAIILGDLIIGEKSMVGAGAVVTKNVPSRALVLGSPARVVGWLNDDGTKMEKKENYYLDNTGAKWILDNNSLLKYE